MNIYDKRAINVITALRSKNSFIFHIIVSFCLIYFTKNKLSHEGFFVVLLCSLISATMVTMFQWLGERSRVEGDYLVVKSRCNKELSNLNDLQTSMFILSIFRRNGASLE